MQFLGNSLIQGHHKAYKYIFLTKICQLYLPITKKPCTLFLSIPCQTFLHFMSRYVIQNKKKLSTKEKDEKHIFTTRIAHC